MAERGSAGNVVAAIASFAIPGLGQLAQGRVGAAFGFGLAALFCALLWAALGFVAMLFSLAVAVAAAAGGGGAWQCAWAARRRSARRLNNGGKS